MSGFCRSGVRLIGVVDVMGVFVGPYSGALFATHPYYNPGEYDYLSQAAAMGPIKRARCRANVLTLFVCWRSSSLRALRGYTSMHSKRTPMPRRPLCSSSCRISRFISIG